MNVSDLVRDSAKVHAALTQSKSGVLVATKPLKIYVPARYQERELMVIANEIRTVAIFAIVVDDKYYGVSTVNARIQLTPSWTNIVKVDDEEYYEFGFDKGAQVTPNINLVKDDLFVYKIYDEIIAKGNVPWFLSYLDLGKLFTTAKSHGGINLAANNIPLEMIAAAISRQDKDRTKFYRHALGEGKKDIKPAFIPFRSVMYGATNTTAKLMGAYFDEGLTSALVNPSTKKEGVETLLRS